MKCLQLAQVKVSHETILLNRLDARVGDTITLSSEYKAAAKKIADNDETTSPIEPLPGYVHSYSEFSLLRLWLTLHIFSPNMYRDSESTPMVFCG